MTRFIPPPGELSRVSLSDVKIGGRHGGISPRMAEYRKVNRETGYLFFSRAWWQTIEKLDKRPSYQYDPLKLKFYRQVRW